MQDYILQLFSIAAIGIVIFCVVSICATMFGVKWFKKTYLKAQIELIFIVSLFATVGSILLSLYFGLVPCELCWYQRTMLFPLPLLALIAILRKDVVMPMYAFVFSGIGFVLAAYHTLLQAGVFGHNAAFCNPMAAVDCSSPAFLYYGFVTIPFISLSIFLLLLVISYPYEKTT